AGEINPKLIKQRLAREIVALYHGDKAALIAEEEFNQIFSKGELPDEIPEYTLEQDKIGIMELLVKTGVCESNGEVKRLIKQNAITIDGEKISDIFLEIGSETVIKIGKRRFLKVVR
ncbi:MAG: tyrosine--tRNA ligase, partial [Candidatus Cloacimonetes bacterium]|nr:tyrosine--tRNA ligase [Candidatus Cloacimonadota bacterium]